MMLCAWEAAKMDDGLTLARTAQKLIRAGLGSIQRQMSRKVVGADFFTNACSRHFYAVLKRFTCLSRMLLWMLGLRQFHTSPLRFNLRRNLCNRVFRAFEVCGECLLYLVCAMLFEICFQHLGKRYLLNRTSINAFFVEKKTMKAK